MQLKALLDSIIRPRATDLIAANILFYILIRHESARGSPAVWRNARAVHRTQAGTRSASCRRERVRCPISWRECTRPHHPDEYKWALVTVCQGRILHRLATATACNRRRLHTTPSASLCRTLRLDSTPLPVHPGTTLTPPQSTLTPTHDTPP